MTIAFDQLGTKYVTPGGTTQALTMPGSIAAGDLLIAGRVAWTSGYTFTDEANWTPAGELMGGTGSSNDAHATGVRGDYKVAVGGEGTTTFDYGGAPGGFCGVVAKYSKGAGNTWDIASATGDDATHAVNRLATATTNVDLQVNDVVVAIVAVDTDFAGAITSPAITAPGITFGTTLRRSPASTGSTLGQDGNIEVFDAPVTAGSATAALSLAYSFGTAQCGPVLFIRLREIVPGGPTPFVGWGVQAA